MLEIFLFYTFILISLLNILHFGFYLIGANYYDFLRFRKSKELNKRYHNVRPLVSVIIPAHNEEKSIERCLNSVLRSSYRKLEVLVVDDASSDSTRSIVREYIRNHPKAKIRLMFKRKNGGKAIAMNHALKNGVKGALVMSLDADSLIHKHSIANAVRYFDDLRVVGVAANVRILDTSTILGLLQKFEYIIGYRAKKFFTVTNSEFIVGGVASTYRTSVLKDVGFYDHDIITEDIALSLKIVSRGNKENRIVYAVDVVAMTEGVQKFKALVRQRYRWKMGSLQSIIKYRKLFASRSNLYTKSLTWYRIPLAFLGEFLLLVEPFILGYVVYLCLMLNSPSLIVGAYMTITIYLLWNILHDEHMSWSKKIGLSLYSPVMYFIMYIMNVVQVTAIIRCLFNYRQVIRTIDTKSTWESPERQGELAKLSF